MTDAECLAWLLERRCSFTYDPDWPPDVWTGHGGWSDSARGATIQELVERIKKEIEPPNRKDTNEA